MNYVKIHDQVGYFKKATDGCPKSKLNHAKNGVL